MASKAELALILSLVDDVSKTAKGVKGNLRGIGEEAVGLQGRLKQVGKIGLAAVATGTAAAAAAIGAAAKIAWNAAMTVDEAMDTIAVGTGATGEKLDGLRKSYESVMRTTAAESTAIAGAMAAYSARVGAQGDVLEALTQRTVEWAKMTGGDATAQAALFSRTLGDWAVPAEQGSALLDRMFVASQKTGIGFDRLNQLLVQFGSPMRLMGFSIEESTAMLAKWEKEGVNTELVMGSLRIAAGRFAREGRPLRASLLQTFESIQKNTNASAALAEGMAVFGARAGPDMVAAIREGRFAIDDLVAMMENSEGAIQGAVRATEDWPEKLERARNAATVFLAPIGEAFTDLAGKVLDRVGPAFERLGPWIEERIVPAFDRMSGAVDVFFRGLDLGKGPVEAFKDVLWTLLPPGVAADVTGIVTEIQRLAGLVREGDWSQLGADLWSLVQTGFQEAITLGEGLAEKLRGKLATALGLAGGNDMGAGAGDQWGSIGKEIRDRIVQQIVDLSGVLVEFTKNLKLRTESEEGMADAEAAGRAIGRWVLDAIHGLFSSDEEGQAILTALIANLLRAALNLHDVLANVGSSIGTGIITEMTSAIESEEEVEKIRGALRFAVARANPYGFMIETLREARDQIKRWREDPWLQWLFRTMPIGKGNPLMGAPIGANAAGTDYWRGGPTWVGERGPEIVVPPRGSRILNNEESKATAGASYQIVQNFYGPTDAKQVELGVLRGLRAAGVAI